MIAYLDLPSGLSGDMFLGCLVDCGWPVERLRQTVERLKLPAEEWSIEARDVKKNSIRAKFVDVRAREGHAHRHLKHVVAIIEAADLADVVKQRAIAIFTRLADAEARVHGTTREKIHFHEVGAVDAIIDIVGASAGIHDLGIERIFASPVPLGDGFGHMAHGQIPLPAPATLELLAAVSAPTRPGPGPGEWVTPTGAAILAECATFEQPSMTLTKIGMGAGSKDTVWPNIARMWLGELQHRGPMVQLETNIDDMNPQFYQAITEKLFAAGAKDVWITPVQMKKGRPGVVLSALAPAANEPALAQVFLRETTTLGVRVHSIQHRHEARREIRSVETSLGQARVKIKWIGSEVAGVMPEHDDCRKIAEATQMPLKSVWETVAMDALRSVSTT
ncbi:MAG TPA: nickel pincer cofactor biosynthesis protein LarC [Tepidisphaeraceae bacterium]|jgi:hypothetical protein